MAIEKSPYEGMLEERLNGNICLGKVVSVNVEKRTCQVKTEIGMKGVSDALDLYDVQWQSMSASVDGQGDEDTTIPRVGMHAVVTFLNSQPYIVGFYRPTPAFSSTDPVEAALDSARSSLNHSGLSPGDRIIKTVAGNYILLRSGGSVEILTNEGLCKTSWLPTESVISSLAESYELTVSGGLMFWTHDRDSDESSLRYLIYDKGRAPAHVMDFQFGTTKNPNHLITAKLGPADPTSRQQTSTTLDLSVAADGSVSLALGQGSKILLKLNGATGDIELTTQGNITQTVTGNVTQTVTGKVTVKTDSDVSVTAKGDALVKAKKIKLNGEQSGITTINSHGGVVDLITGVPIRPSKTVFSDV